jgi:small subunit ribosomal protein S1
MNQETLSTRSAERASAAGSTAGVTKSRNGMKLMNSGEGFEYDQAQSDQLLALYEGTLGKIKAGEIVKGRIAAIGESDVSIDIGFKSDGLVSLAEFPNQKELKIGDEVEVFLESVEDKDGQLVLSRKRADFMRIWERVTKSSESGEVLQGRCIRRIKGGIVVDLMGIEAFLPGSQIDVRPVRDFDAFIGKNHGLPRGED